MKKILLILMSLVTLMTQAQNMPYITKVYDLLPAPGQFINTLPTCVYVNNEPRDSVIARAEKALCGTCTIDTDSVEMPDGSVVAVNDTTMNVAPGMISLGSFGGYVVFGFDHPVVNVNGAYDMQIFGNGFQAANSSSSGGSSEPGIVMVSRDDNHNGVPDDTWYELAGSEYNNPKTQKHFTITYYKPDENKTPVTVPGQSYVTDAEYIRWTSNSVDSLQEGYVRKNSFHSQSYWPQWVEGETLTFTGTRLPCNAVDESGNGTYWVQHFYDWGYVDNRSDEGYGYKANPSGVDPETLSRGFNIDWAVDDEGNPISLGHIDFVKVYCAILQDCGWLGETSTEVCGAIDLHPNEPLPDNTPVAGDINGDGKVDVTDVNLVINMMLGKVEYAAVADINADGRVDVSDVNAIINLMLGITNN